jgi:NDP-sugar pyrophosphorylase family protein
MDANELAHWPVAILAGGLGTRLRPLTESVPKALIPVAGIPFLAHQLRLLRASGLRRVVLCVGHLGHMIKSEFGDGASHNVDLSYSFDGDRLLGTGGALRRALPLLGQRFFVLYGDSYLPIDYQPVARAFLKSKCPALMTVFRNEGRWDSSNVIFSEGRIVKYRKGDPLPEMQHIDYGLAVLRAETLADWPVDQPFDLAEVYQMLATEGRLAGFEVTERFYEIGSVAGCADLERFLRFKVPAGTC